MQVAAETAEVLKRALDPTVRAAWVPQENMHLTVRFIGQVDDNRGPALIGALTPPLDMKPFVVELGECGVFPSSGPPRVIWMGVTEGLPALAAMHAEFNRRLLPFGFEPDRRAFSAHLTLARIKDAPRGAGRSLRESLRRVTPRTPPSRIAAATIFQSHLSPKGARYERLAHVPCRD